MNRLDLRNYRLLMIILWLGLLVFAAAGGSAADRTAGSARPDSAPTIDEIIRRAGNAEDDKIRYQLLLGLMNRPDLGAELKKELNILLPVIDDWANGYEQAVQGALNKKPPKRYLHRDFHKNIDLKNDYPGPIPKGSALYPLWCFYRARFLIWFQIERDDYDSRDLWFDEGRRLLKDAQQAFPENPIIGMYLGEAIPWPADFQPDPNAPRWANLQREELEKLTDVIHWWIDQRQLPDGQYGGNWGDDVEMWRWWTPLLIGFEDKKINEAQIKLSVGRLSEPEMKDGYTSVMNDVEHGAEETADTLTPGMHIMPDHPKLKEWALRLAELMRTRWTGVNDRGFLQFKSAYFNVHEVDTRPQQACDTVFHPRAVEPALLYWQRTGDKALGKLFTAWMETWVDAAASQDRGKPVGVLPSTIHWPDGRVGGLSEPWWRPKIYHNDLYAWPSNMDYMTKTLMLTYYMTGDRKYLDPIVEMIGLAVNYGLNPLEQKPPAGSAAWCATIGGKNGDGMASFLPDTAAKLRLLTGVEKIDELLLQSKINGYLKMRISGDFEYLDQDLSKSNQAWQINRPAFTSEVRYTDRVLEFSDRWYNRGNGWSYPTPNVSLLYSMVTGDPGDYAIFPMNAVRWLTEPRAIAVLVTDSGLKKLAAQLYHFGASDREMGARFLILTPGRYRVTLAGSDGRMLTDQVITVDKRVARIAFRLPARQLCLLQVSEVLE